LNKKGPERLKLDKKDPDWMKKDPEQMKMFLDWQTRRNSSLFNKNSVP